MRQRPLTLAIVFLLIVLLGGCDKQDEPVVSPSDTLPTISVVTTKFDAGNFDGDLVAQALDAYVTPLIGAHVSLQYVEAEHYGQVFNTYMATDNMPDVFLMSSPYLVKQFMGDGQLMPLDELLQEHGRAIVQVIGKELLNAHVYDGKTYAVPNLHDRAHALCFEYRKNMADDYGLNMADVKTIEDLSAVLIQLKQKNSDLVPMSSYNFRSWDPLLDSLGVLMDCGRNTQVVNLYETEEYRNICLTINQWRENDLLLNEDYGLTSANNFVRSPEFFGKLCGFHPGLPYVDSTDAGEPIECVILGEPYTYTDRNKAGSWAISAGSGHPKKAMAFLNLMFTDPNVVNLLTFGIEDLHYEVVDRDMGIIDFPEGVTVETSGYVQFRGYQNGNQFIGYLWNGWPEDLWELIQAFNREAVRSVAYGFSYDPSPVADLVSACREVVAEHTPMLEKGFGDVDALLAAFRSALREAGIDQIVAEKQRQLDAWLASGRAQ